MQNSNNAGYVEVFDLTIPPRPRCYDYIYQSKDAFAAVIRWACLWAAHRYGLWVINPNLDEAPNGALTVDYNRSDTSVTPTPLFDAHRHPHARSGLPRPGKPVTLQGRGERPRRVGRAARGAVAARAGLCSALLPQQAIHWAWLRSRRAQGSYECTFEAPPPAERRPQPDADAGTLHMNLGDADGSDAIWIKPVNILDFSI